MTTNNTISVVAKAIKWIARIYSVLIFIVAAIVAANPTPLLNRPLLLIDWLTLLLFPGVPIIGLLLAWRWEALGGAITFISWLFHFFIKRFTTGIWFVDFGEVILWFFAFAFPSLLFLISWALSRSQPQVIKKKETKTETKLAHDLNSEIRNSADYAIRITKEKLNISLSFDESSLQTLEGLLDKAFQNFSELSKQSKLEEKTIQQNTKTWGSYLGELIRHRFGGEWHKEAEAYVLQVKGISFYPHSFVQQRVTINPKYSAIQYYDDVSNRISVFNKSNDVPTTEKKKQAEEKDFTQPKKPTFGPYVVLGIIILCALSLLGIFLINQTNQATPSTFTPLPTNRVNDCDSTEVNTWIDQTVPRLNAIDSDLEFLASYPPTSYDDYIPYAESAKQRYYAQLSQRTPTCLEGIQGIALEELRLFWKGLEAAANGDRDAMEDYFSHLIELSSQVDRAFQEVEENK